MYPLDQDFQIGHQLVEGLAKGLPASDQHIIVVGSKVTRASCHSGAKTAFYAVALGRIAGFLGDGEAHPGRFIGNGRGLQSKRRPPGAIAPGSP